MTNKKLKLLWKITALLLPVIICYAALYLKGFLPLLTNSISFDAKYYEIKRRQFKDVELVSIGSSMTLTNLSSEVIIDHTKLRYYNFSSWNLQISDIDNLIRNYVLQYNPRTVIICSSTPDFTSQGNLKLPDNFKLSHYYLPYFYLENFNSVLEVIKREKELNEDNKDNNRYASLKFDNYGGVPLYIKKGNLSSKLRNERIPFPTDFTGGQYLALKNLAAFLKSKCIKLIFVQTPIMRSYRYDSVIKLRLESHFTKCKTIVDAQGGYYLNFYDARVFADSLFVDNLHLSSFGAKIFTEQIVKNIKLK